MFYIGSAMLNFESTLITYRKWIDSFNYIEYQIISNNTVIEIENKVYSIESTLGHDLQNICLDLKRKHINIWNTHWCDIIFTIVQQNQSLETLDIIWMKELVHKMSVRYTIPQEVNVFSH